jgi:hypothetical protein
MTKKRLPRLIIDFKSKSKMNARLHLGLQIKESIETKGQCHFEAEL